MKVGIVGGIGPASTLDYYREIINGYRRVTQSDEYPDIVIDSINMTLMLNLLDAEDWDGLINMLRNSIKNLKLAGATFAVIASNTPHLVFDRLNEKSDLPLISIVDETCKEALKRGYNKLVLLGTIFTMKRDFYARTMKKYGIQLVVPTRAEQEEIHSLFFPNLENGIVVPADKAKVLNIAKTIVEREKAQALILGCTELPLMIRQEDLCFPILDTTQIHINAIIDKLCSAI